MATISSDLPLPAGGGDGVGPYADIAQNFGRPLTIQVFGNYEGSVTIQGTNREPFGNTETAAPIATFTNNERKKVVNVSVASMRVVIRGSNGNQPDSVVITGNDDGQAFVALSVPAGDGVGGSSSISALGGRKSISCTSPNGNSFTGTVSVEISDDGTNWAECAFFSRDDLSVGDFYAEFARVRRRNVSGGGTPFVVFSGIPDAVTINPQDQFFGLMDTKLVSDAPNSGSTPVLLSQTGAGSPNITLQTVFPPRGGYVIGLSCLIDPALTDPDDRITLNAEVSTNGGASFTPLAASLTIAGNSGFPNRANANFAENVANTFGGGNILRLSAAYASVGTPSGYTGLITGHLQLRLT